jgi:hypothetical protein
MKWLSQRVNLAKLVKIYDILMEGEIRLKKTKSEYREIVFYSILLSIQKVI